MLLTESRMKALDRDYDISLLKILEKEKLVFLGVSSSGKNARLIVYDLAQDRADSPIEIPLKEVGYAAVNESGTLAVIYSQWKDKFVAVNMASGTVKEIFQRERGKAGYGLFGANKSKMTFVGDWLMVWGFHYDKSGKMACPCVAQVDVTKAGLGAFRRIAEIEDLEKAALRHVKDFIRLKDIVQTRDTIAFSAVDKTGRGALISYNVNNKGHKEIDRFAHLMGIDVNERTGRLAYVKSDAPGKTSQARLYCYDIAKGSRESLGEGRFFNPVFSNDGTHLAVGDARSEPGAGMNITIFEMLNGETIRKSASLSSGKMVLAWKFAADASSLLLFDLKNIYRLSINH
jgi:hypothetical protein